MNDTGLFGPGSATWRISGEAALMLGGGRALIMQVAHPLVGAGVEQHSRFRADQWRRLGRTLDVMGGLLFGDAEEVAHATRRLAAAHRRVAGEVTHGTTAGRRYDAADPDLMLWVWATLVDTSLVVHERYVGSLDGDEVERFYREQTRLARACGVPEGHWPRDHAAFAAYVAEMTDTALEVTPIVRTVTEMVRNPLGLPRIAQPLMAGPNLTTVGLLPPSLRSALGLRWTPLHELAFAASARAVRTMLPALPDPLRRIPAARDAARRAHAGRHCANI